MENSRFNASVDAAKAKVEQVQHKAEEAGAALKEKAAEAVAATSDAAANIKEKVESGVTAAAQTISSAKVSGDQKKKKCVIQ